MSIMKRLTATILLASTALTATACGAQQPDEKTLLSQCSEASSDTTDIGVMFYDGDPTTTEVSSGVWLWQQDVNYRDDKFISREATINCYHDGSEVVDLTVTGRGMDAL